VTPAGPVVAGVAVTYNPGPYLVGQAGCRLVRNERNLGIAAALNQGAAAALEAGTEWLAMFDQDSLPPASAVDALLQVVREHPRGDRIGIIAMTDSDQGAGRPSECSSTSWTTSSARASAGTAGSWSKPPKW